MGFDPLRIGYLRLRPGGRARRGRPRTRSRSSATRSPRSAAGACRTRTTRSSATGTAWPRSRPPRRGSAVPAPHARPPGPRRRPADEPPTGRAVAVVVALTDPAPPRLGASLARFADEAGPRGEVVLVDASGDGDGRRRRPALRQRPGPPPARRPARPGTLARRPAARPTPPLVAFSTAQMVPASGLARRAARPARRDRARRASAGRSSPGPGLSADRPGGLPAPLLGLLPAPARPVARRARRATTPSIAATG